MTLRRRHLLAGAAGLALGLPTLRRARASWGTWPEEHAHLALPEDRTASRILELYLYGGLSAWDTFYCCPTWGASDQRYLYAFGESALNARLQACGLPGELARPFAEDLAGELIHLGPWAAPLWDRPDLLARMRVVVLRHEQFPHSTAVPLALTGTRIGQPDLAGTGAAVERFFRERDGTTTPHAVVVHPGDITRLDNVQSALAVGLHESAARPLELSLTSAPQLLKLLERPETADRRDAHDAVVAALADRYRARLRNPPGTPLRAPEFATWQAVDAARRRAPELAGLIPPSVFGVGLGEACGESALSIPGLGLRVATHLLRAIPEPVRYALWIDAGLRPTLDGGHDTHRDHLFSAAINYTHTLRRLADAIAAPGDPDPTKLDLDDTLIAITTEFGRTPHREDHREGLGHWPSGYVAVLLGGPVDAPAVAGAIARDTGVATDYATPTELRIALLLALGIYPFDPGGFGVADVRAADARAALLRLRTDILGVPA
jgi:hypothetical protein